MVFWDYFKEFVRKTINEAPSQGTMGLLSAWWAGPSPLHSHQTGLRDLGGRLALWGILMSSGPATCTQGTGLGSAHPVTQSRLCSTWETRSPFTRASHQGHGSSGTAQQGQASCNHNLKYKKQMTAGPCLLFLMEIITKTVTKAWPRNHMSSCRAWHLLEPVQAGVTPWDICSRRNNRRKARHLSSHLTPASG